MDLLRGMTQSLKAVADLLLPRTCIACEKRLHPNEEHLCSECLADIPLTRFHMLRHNPMADKFNDAIQKYLEEQWTADTYPGRLQLEKYAYAIALFFYSSGSDYRHITHRIKYQSDLKAGEFFGRMLGREILSAEWFQDVDAVVPVPLHWTRKWARGYNQAEIIARAVARETGVPIKTDILKRTRRTKTQTKVGIADKGANVRNAFQVQDHHPDGMVHILLVDDVFTTGSTLGECFKALRKVYPPSVRISVATLGFVGGA